MNKVLSLVLSILSFTAISQDTTWVQTFTFDSISTRRAVFDFPQELDDMRFEKVLMYYKLKCDAATPWDQYACGEWDYLTYTQIFDHTGNYDSVRVDSVRYLHNLQSDQTYKYDVLSSIHVDTLETIESFRNLIGLNQITVPQIGGTPSEQVFSRYKNGSRFQMLITAQELTDQGLSAGSVINSLALNVTALAINGSLNHPLIRLKHSGQSPLLNWENSGFQTVYDLSRNNFTPAGELTIGWNDFDFHTPFVWNGTDNIVVEFFTQQGVNATNTIEFEMDNSAGAGLFYDGRNGYLELNGSNQLLLELSDIDLGNELTVAFWSKGNGNTGVNTYFMEGSDTLGNRVFNIHMPWSDNTLYFDCGQGSGYDRIQKSMSGQGIDNEWHHWTFVKDQPNGSMYIYRDGILWHSGAGKNLPIGELHRLILGASKNQTGNWKGWIDEFQMFNTVVDAGTIATWYNKKLDNTHPDWSNLLVYYDFDEEEYLIDRSPNDYLAMPSAYGMVGKKRLNESVEQYPLIQGQAISRPLFSLGIGTDNTPSSQYNGVYLSNKEPQTVFEFQTVDRHFEIVNAYLTIAEGSHDRLNSSDVVINATPFIGSETITNEQITNYQTPFELVNNVEIGRYITPYGIQFDLGPGGFTWIYDITDYQMYLHGAVDLGAHNTQELIDLKFAFIEGIPPRDVHSRRPIWSEWRSYTYGQMDNDSELSSVSIPLSDTSSMFKIKTRFTGHGHNGSVNCCEWDSKDHYIMVDGIQRFNWEIWEETACGDNPNVSQGGTWPYAREGWCPGDMVKEYDHELTPFVTPGSTVEIDYDIENVPAFDPQQANGNYIVAMDLISYGPPNFQNDAAVIDILNPNDWEYYKKWNPSCQNPRVIIQNTGEQPLTSCKITVWVDWGNKLEYDWTGNLNFLEKEIVEIPVDDYSFWYDYQQSGTFTAHVNFINQQWGLDEYPHNNEKTVTYEAPESINGPFLVWFTTNNKASENKWRLVDSHENIIFERTSLTNSTQYKDTFDLAPGCYSIILEDNDSDGISFWYSNQTEGETAGTFNVKLVGGTIVEYFERDFGNYHRYNFTVGFDLGVENMEEVDEVIHVFPNPNNGTFNVEISGNIDHEAYVSIMDLTGREIWNDKMNAKLDYAEALINLPDMPAGFYQVIITTKNDRYARSFIKH